MKKRTLFFRLGAIAILLAIAAVMMVIGRGHTSTSTTRSWK